MNYYIQGDAANADKIRAAFKAKGISDGGNSFIHGNYLYFSEGGEVDFCGIGGHIANIIKTHPDYQELELPVESKFKVGDWVVTNYGKVSQVVSVDNDGDGYTLDDGVYFSDSWCDMYHLWSIADAKDGDVLMTTSIRNCPFIYRKTSYNNNLAYYYAGIDGNGDFCEGCLKRTLCHFGHVKDVVPATKEQRDLLFKKMKEAGYEWDADKKELKKIPKHYDISNFYAGMPVLVRDKDNHDWNYVLFSHCTKYSDCRFGAGSTIWHQCIPFEGNEHLLGTTDPCDEQYINW